MNNRDTIIAYLEDTLSMQERERFEVELAESQELSRELEQYRQLFAMEQELANVEAEIGPDFTVRVMDSIENGSSLARFFERYMQMSRKVLMPAVGLAVVVLCVMVAKDVNESGVEFDKIGESLSRVPAVETSVSDIGVVGDREQSGLRTQELKKESSEALVDELEAPKDQDKFQANSSGSSLSELRNELDSKGQEQFQGGGQIGSLAKSSVAPKAKSRSAKPSVIPGQIRDRVFQRKAEVLGRSQEESALVASVSRLGSSSRLF